MFFFFFAPNSNEYKGLPDATRQTNPSENWKEGTTSRIAIEHEMKMRCMKEHLMAKHWHAWPLALGVNDMI